MPNALFLRVRRILHYRYLQAHLRTEVERQTRIAESRLASSERLFRQMVRALAQTIDAKDGYTSGHSQRVAEYSRRLSEMAGDSVAQQQQILCMALLHDIGKIGVPGYLINKTTRLTEEEYRLIQSHTVIGANILKMIGEFPELSIGARSHHERYDGTGYPDGLMGEEIPRAARIIAVADAYDAMTSRRSYRDILAQPQVRSELVRGRGLQFDPEFADLMIRMMDADVDYLMRDTESERHIGSDWRRMEY